MICRLSCCVTGVALVILFSFVTVAAQDLTPSSVAAATTTAPAFGTTVPPIGAPIGAVVLFDGKNIEGWASKDGKPCPWKLVDGAMQAGGGNIVSKEKFEDCKVHVRLRRRDRSMRLHLLRLRHPLRPRSSHPPQTQHTAEEMIEHLQHFSRLRLSADGFRTPVHPVWCRGGWKVFLDHPRRSVARLRMSRRTHFPTACRGRRGPS